MRAASAEPLTGMAGGKTNANQASFNSSLRPPTPIQPTTTTPMKRRRIVSANNPNKKH